MKFIAHRGSSFSVTAAAALVSLAAAAFVPSSRGQPPAWPDTAFVANGCYISTAAYLARLRAEYPTVVARAESVRLPSGRWHTIAVVAWERRTYLRDMYIGVAPARGDVQRSYDRALSTWRARGGRHGYSERVACSVAERRAEVEAAAHLLATERTEIVSVLSNRGPTPVLAWTTAAGELALYEPTTGTAVGLTKRSPLEVAQELYGPRGPLALTPPEQGAVHLR